MVRMLRRAYADPDPGEPVRPQVGDDVLQSVVTPGAAPRPDAELPQGQGHVVGNHQDTLRRNLIKSSRQLDGLTAEVHIGLRLDNQHPLATRPDLSGQRTVTEFVEFDALPAGQLIGGHEADIVPGCFILLPRVAQADQEPLIIGSKHGVPFFAARQAAYAE